MDAGEIRAENGDHDDLVATTGEYASAAGSMEAKRNFRIFLRETVTASSHLQLR